MFDIGVNLLDRRFASDREAVVARAVAAGVEGLLLTGTDLASSQAALAYCRSFPGSGMWLGCTAGVHPHSARRFDAATCDVLQDLLLAPEVRAVGETGLDFNRNFSPADDQRAAFVAHMELAARAQLPLFVHDRDSAGETAQLLARHARAVPAVVVHCFTGSATDLARYLAAGYYIGITGWVCDPRRGAALAQLVTTIPDDRLLVETDAPYLWPRTAPDKPSGGRNEPCYLPWVVRELARLRGCTVDHLAAVTTANARRVFGSSTSQPLRLT